MIMNKILILSICLFMSYSSMSQEDLKMDNVKAKRIAFITDELNLTSQQAEKFWPLYNAYSKNKKENRKEKRDADERYKSLTDAQAKTLLTELINQEENKVKDKKEFVEKLKSVIDVKQILLLFRAERKFKRELFRDYKRQIRVIKID